MTFAISKPIARHWSISNSLTNRERIVKTTVDGMLVAFPGVVSAVRCAIEIQVGMAERNAEVAEDWRMLFRIGIKLGDVIVENGDHTPTV